MDLEMCEFWKLKASRKSALYLGDDKLCTRLKRVVNIFKGASIYKSNNPVKSKNTKIYNLWNNITYNNESVELCIKFLYYHLEQLDSLREKTCQPIEELGRLYSYVAIGRFLIPAFYSKSLMRRGLPWNSRKPCRFVLPAENDLSWLQLGPPPNLGGSSIDTILA